MEVDFQLKLNEEQKKQWFEFWNNCRHSYARQHYIYGEIERAKGRIPIYTTGYVNGCLVCIAIFSIRPMFFGNKFSLEAYCLRGPAFDDVSFFKEFIQLVITQFRQLHIGSIRISPYWQFPEAEEVESILKELKFDPYTQIGCRENTGFVTLSENENEMMSNLSKKVRYNIRRAQKEGISFRPIFNMNEALVAYRCLKFMRSKRGLIPMSQSEFEATFEHVFKNQKHGLLLGAFLEKNFLAALWLIKGLHIVNTPCYAIEPKACKRLAKKLTIGHPLWWKGMLWAKEKGCLWLDVEGYSENTERSNSVYQIHRFKKQFHPIATQIISQHVYICNSVIHNLHKGRNFAKRGYRFLRSLPYQIETRHFFNR